MKNILIISAHADDEVLGMGGTMLRFAKQRTNVNVHWLIMTSVWLPKWTETEIAKRKKAIELVAEHLSIKSIEKWDYKDNLLDTYSKNELQEKLISFLDKLKPHTIFTPSPWDFNFESGVW